MNPLRVLQDNQLGIIVEGDAHFLARGPTIGQEARAKLRVNPRPLREAFPEGAAPRHPIFDRDSRFSPSVVATVKSFGMKASRTA